MATYRDQGIVLRTTKLGETDRILHLFLQSRGKVRAVAKGVRRPGSRFGGRLEPYSHVDLQLYEGRNLDIVQQAELIAPHDTVRASFDTSAAAAVMVELVDHVAVEGERDHSLFLLLRSGLQALDARPVDPSVFVDAFVLRAARTVGFHPFTGVCARCRTPGVHPFLSVTGGGSLCPDCAPAATKTVSPEVVRLVGLFTGDDWRSLADVDDTADRRTAGSYARAFVEHHLDRRLKAYPSVPRTAATR